MYEFRTKTNKETSKKTPKQFLSWSLRWSLDQLCLNFFQSNQLGKRRRLRVQVFFHDVDTLDAYSSISHLIFWEKLHCVQIPNHMMHFVTSSCSMYILAVGVKRLNFFLFLFITPYSSSCEFMFYICTMLLFAH